jgi:hypothetical protein
MVKLTGSEWNRFYNDAGAWPDGAWHEDEEITVDGKTAGDDLDLSAVPDGAMLTVEGGVVYLTEDADYGPSLEAHFKRWRKRQTTTVLVVEVPHEAVKVVRAAIAAAGGKVIRDKE